MGMPINSVLATNEQHFTEGQKARARENIDAIGLNDIDPPSLLIGYAESVTGDDEFEIIPTTISGNDIRVAGSGDDSQPKSPAQSQIGVACKAGYYFVSANFLAKRLMGEDPIDNLSTFAVVAYTGTPLDMHGAIGQICTYDESRSYEQSISMGGIIHVLHDDDLIHFESSFYSEDESIGIELQSVHIHKIASIVANEGGGGGGGDPADCNVFIGDENNTWEDFVNAMLDGKLLYLTVPIPGLSGMEAPMILEGPSFDLGILLNYGYTREQIITILRNNNYEFPFEKRAISGDLDVMLAVSLNPQGLRPNYSAIMMGGGITLSKDYGSNSYSTSQVTAYSWDDENDELQEDDSRLALACMKMYTKGIPIYIHYTDPESDGMSWTGTAITFSSHYFDDFEPSVSIVFDLMMGYYDFSYDTPFIPQGKIEFYWDPVKEYNTASPFYNQGPFVSKRYKIFSDNELWEKYLKTFTDVNDVYGFHPGADGIYFDGWTFCDFIYDEGHWDDDDNYVVDAFIFDGGDYWLVIEKETTYDEDSGHDVDMASYRFIGKTWRTDRPINADIQTDPNNLGLLHHEITQVYWEYGSNTSTPLTFIPEDIYGLEQFVSRIKAYNGSVNDVTITIGAAVITLHSSESKVIDILDNIVTVQDFISTIVE